MVAKRQMSIPLAVAELINRMTSEEQEAFAAQLSWEQLHTLEALKQGQEAQTKAREPYIYVSIGLDSISFESHSDKVAQLVQRIAANLTVETVTVRFLEDENAREFHRPVSELDELLAEETESLADEPVVIEMDGSTLYSQGGGCLFLKTSASGRTKRAIAEAFLQICGYPHQVQSDRFTALVRNGVLETIES